MTARCWWQVQGFATDFGAIAMGRAGLVVLPACIAVSTFGAVETCAALPPQDVALFVAIRVKNYAERDIIQSTSVAQRPL